jgi:hypothetical protein
MGGVELDLSNMDVKRVRREGERTRALDRKKWHLL